MVKLYSGLKPNASHACLSNCKDSLKTASKLRAEIGVREVRLESLVFELNNAWRSSCAQRFHLRLIVA